MASSGVNIEERGVGGSGVDPSAYFICSFVPLIDDELSENEGDDKKAKEVEDKKAKGASEPSSDAKESGSPVEPDTKPKKVKTPGERKFFAPPKVANEEIYDVVNILKQKLTDLGEESMISNEVNLKVEKSESDSVNDEKRIVENVFRATKGTSLNKMDEKIQNSRNHQKNGTCRTIILTHNGEKTPYSNPAEWCEAVIGNEAKKEQELIKNDSYIPSSSTHVPTNSATEAKEKPNFYPVMQRGESRSPKKCHLSWFYDELSRKRENFDSQNGIKLRASDRLRSPPIEYPNCALNMTKNDKKPVEKIHIQETSKKGKVNAPFVSPFTPDSTSDVVSELPSSSPDSAENNEVQKPRRRVRKSSPVKKVTHPEIAEKIISENDVKKVTKPKKVVNSCIIANKHTINGGTKTSSVKNKAKFSDSDSSSDEYEKSILERISSEKGRLLDHSLKNERTTGSNSTAKVTPQSTRDVYEFFDESTPNDQTTLPYQSKAKSNPVQTSEMRAGSQKRKPQKRLLHKYVNQEAAEALVLMAHTNSHVVETSKKNQRETTKNSKTKIKRNPAILVNKENAYEESEKVDPSICYMETTTLKEALRIPEPPKNGGKKLNSSTTQKATTKSKFPAKSPRVRKRQNKETVQNLDESLEDPKLHELVCSENKIADFIPNGRRGAKKSTKKVPNRRKKTLDEVTASLSSPKKVDVQEINEIAKESNFRSKSREIIRKEPLVVNKGMKLRKRSSDSNSQAEETLTNSAKVVDNAPMLESTQIKQDVLSRMNNLNINGSDGETKLESNDIDPVCIEVVSSIQDTLQYCEESIAEIVITSNEQIDLKEPEINGSSAISDGEIQKASIDLPKKETRSRGGKRKRPVRTRAAKVTVESLPDLNSRALEAIKETNPESVSEPAENVEAVTVCMNCEIQDAKLPEEIVPPSLISEESVITTFSTDSMVFDSEPINEIIITEEKDKDSTFQLDFPALNADLPFEKPQINRIDCEVMSLEDESPTALLADQIIEDKTNYCSQDEHSNHAIDLRTFKVKESSLAIPAGTQNESSSAIHVNEDDISLCKDDIPVDLSQEFEDKSSFFDAKTDTKDYPNPPVLSAVSEASPHEEESLPPILENGNTGKEDCQHKEDSTDETTDVKEDTDPPVLSPSPLIQEESLYTNQESYGQVKEDELDSRAHLKEDANPPDLSASIHDDSCRITEESSSSIQVDADPSVYCSDKGQFQEENAPLIEVTEIKTAFQVNEEENSFTAAQETEEETVIEVIEEKIPLALSAVTQVTELKIAAPVNKCENSLALPSATHTENQTAIQASEDENSIILLSTHITEDRTSIQESELHPTLVTEDRTSIQESELHPTLVTEDRTSVQENENLNFPALPSANKDNSIALLPTDIIEDKTAIQVSEELNFLALPSSSQVTATQNEEENSVTLLPAILTTEEKIAAQMNEDLDSSALPSPTQVIEETEIQVNEENSSVLHATEVEDDKAAIQDNEDQHSSSPSASQETEDKTDVRVNEDEDSIALPVTETEAEAIEVNEDHSPATQATEDENYIQEKYFPATQVTEQEIVIELTKDENSSFLSAEEEPAIQVSVENTTLHPEFVEDSSTTVEEGSTIDVKEDTRTDSVELKVQHTPCPNTTDVKDAANEDAQDINTEEATTPLEDTTDEKTKPEVDQHQENPNLVKKDLIIEDIADSHVKIDEQSFDGRQESAEAHEIKSECEEKCQVNEVPETSDLLKSQPDQPFLSPQNEISDVQPNKDIIDSEKISILNIRDCSAVTIVTTKENQSEASVKIAKKSAKTLPVCENSISTSEEKKMVKPKRGRRGNLQKRRNLEEQKRDLEEIVIPMRGTSSFKVPSKRGRPRKRPIEEKKTKISEPETSQQVNVQRNETEEYLRNHNVSNIKEILNKMNSLCPGNTSVLRNPSVVLSPYAKPPDINVSVDHSDIIEEDLPPPPQTKTSQTIRNDFINIEKQQEEEREFKFKSIYRPQPICKNPPVNQKPSNKTSKKKPKKKVEKEKIDILKKAMEQLTSLTEQLKNFGNPGPSHISAPPPPFLPGPNFFGFTPSIMPPPFLNPPPCNESGSIPSPNLNELPNFGNLPQGFNPMWPIMNNQNLPPPIFHPGVQQMDVEFYIYLTFICL